MAMMIRPTSPTRAQSQLLVCGQDMVRLAQATLLGAKLQGLVLHTTIPAGGQSSRTLLFLPWQFPLLGKQAVIRAGNPLF